MEVGAIIGGVTMDILPDVTSEKRPEGSEGGQVQRGQEVKL